MKTLDEVYYYYKQVGQIWFKHLKHASSGKFDLNKLCISSSQTLDLFTCVFQTSLQDPTNLIDKDYPHHVSFERTLLGTKIIVGACTE